jgi:hypothetical protein
MPNPDLLFDEDGIRVWGDSDGKVCIQDTEGYEPSDINVTILLGLLKKRELYR